jgi:hypothetical protein
MTTAKPSEREIRHLPGGGVEVKVKVDLREPHDRPELLAERLGISVEAAREMLGDIKELA